MCLSGAAVATDLATGAAHAIEPGMVWIAEKGVRFRFLAARPTRLICVFVPPFEGHETGLATPA